ncbi:transcriptional regulator, LysR family [Noviherbaspirillum humi]|uniref:Transcriptional regulator, LysR family n=1 Tax=Noviherbaspirillum humi TaxID=1688639 RepID=A0A239JT70_9BURK|nr:LysR family transcriptional regulator [Noviherbaspirillum humi]SNT08638.1 transcriptional regulator, LysR family [Noviherbaspirillum humi]
MNFDLGDLRAFTAVVDHGGFAAAAGKLNLSQPALSRRVEKLEEALGVKLFERTTRRVELTPVGRHFIHRARHVLNEVEGALVGVQELADRLAGEVTIAAIPSAVRYFLPSVIAAYHRRFPGIRIRIRDVRATEVLTAVAKSDADFGLTYVGTQEPDLEFLAVFDEQFVLACGRAHPLAGRERVTWRELADHDYIAEAPGSANRTLIDLALAKAAIRPKWFCEVQHVPALVNLVEAGLGVGVVPRLSMPIGEHPALASVPIAEPELTRTLGLIRRRARPLAPAAQHFYDLLLESLRNNSPLAAA